MDAVGQEQAEQRIARCNLTETARQLAPNRDRRRLRAGIYALLGDDRSLASVIAPELIAAANAPAVAAHFEALTGGAQSHDYLAAAVRLSWATDSTGAYDFFNEAHDRATAEKRFYFAVGARERLAHHALLFGDAEVARTALDDALRLALQHRLSEWFARCSAAAARLALDMGDSEYAASLLARAKSHARDAEAVALLAPVGVSLAIEAGDEAGLAEWTSAEILEVALHSEALESAIAATMALLSTQRSSLDPGVSTALRRALLQATGASVAVELFSLAARHGEIEEARFAAESLGAQVGSNRKYIKAHALLARAHLLFRGGERAAWVDQAGDAARAFNAMGLRRWMNEAMLLLVRQEGDDFPRRRGRSVGSALTGREQQVAHLIRRGARNREVAAALQISEHTVERHVSSILGRLGLRSRWQIADPKNMSQD
ncbi:MAG: LuxR C-terminal-related transcriptional regulator [Candidatus Cybelea sp.]